MQTLTLFMRGLWGSPVWVRIWLTILMLVNMLAPLLFLDLFEARLVLVTFMLSFLLLVALTGRFGFTRILGLGHVLWFPLVAYLMTRTNSYPLADPFGLWMRCVIVLNSISLAIDTVDAIRYIRGERSESVPLGQK